MATGRDWCAEEFEGAPLDRGEAGEFLDLPPGEDDGLPVEGGQVIEQVPVAAGGQAVVAVTCPDPCGLGFQELAPGRAVAPGCGIQAGSVEDVAYRTGRYPDPGPCELAADPRLSRGGVLARQAQHRGSDVCPGEGAAWTFPRIGPRAGDQVRGASAAGSQGSRRSRSTTGEAAAATAQPAASDPIVDVWPVHLAGWHGDLVAQRDDLDLVGAFTAPGQDYELEDAVEGEVQQGPEHEQRGCPLPGDAQAINLLVTRWSTASTRVSAPHRR